MVRLSAESRHADLAEVTIYEFRVLGKKLCQSSAFSLG
jgi:hypothetical protein